MQLIGMSSLVNVGPGPAGRTLGLPLWPSETSCVAVGESFNLFVFRFSHL